MKRIFFALIAISLFLSYTSTEARDDKTLQSAPNEKNRPPIIDAPLWGVCFSHSFPASNRPEQIAEAAARLNRSK